VRLADLRPDSAESNLQAAISLAKYTDNSARAALYADRAKIGWRNHPRRVPPDAIASILLFPVLNAWLAGDLNAALRESELLQDALPLLPPEARNIVTARLVDFSTSLGRLDEAERLLEKLADSSIRQALRANLLFASGNKTGLETHLASYTDLNDPLSALLMASSGMSVNATNLESDLRALGISEPKSTVIRASIAFSEGDLNTAESELQLIINDLSADDQAFFFMGLETLSHINKARGKLGDAIRVLEMTTVTRKDAALNGAGLYWLMCQRQLAKFYREAGREFDANAVENELHELLQLADHDFPLLESLGDA
jgi:hypothetical protein